MGTKPRKPDGWMPFFLDKRDGIEYLTIQLEMNIKDIEFVGLAKPQKKTRSNTLGLDPDSGVPIENRQSQPRKKKV
jgi:hypothetical protein